MKAKAFTFRRLWFFVFFVFVFSASAAWGLQLSLSCPQSAEVGQEIGVEVSVDAVDDLFGGSVDIVYNPARVSVVDSDPGDSVVRPEVAEGTVLSADGMDTDLCAGLANNTKGRAVVGISREGQVDGANVSSEQTLFTLYVQALAEGEIGLGIDPDSSVLKNKDLDSIAVDAFADCTTLVSGHAPETPHTPFPPDETNNASVKSVLTWISQDPDAGDTVTYEVYFGTSDPPPLIDQDLSEASYDPGMLNYSTSYYWQIVATNSRGTRVPGPVWQFATFAPTGDEDGDGIDNQTEVDSGCLDPHDADTDDDGLPDGTEDDDKNGNVDPEETDPCEIDSDGDGVQDGTESGVTEDDIGPDTDTEIFQPDLDSDTRTNPLDDDSDGDGKKDGEEDANRDGKTDPGETDPNIPNESPPGVTTEPAKNVNATIATLYGTVNPNGIPTACHFEYGLTDGYGSSTESADAGSGTSAQTFFVHLTGLIPDSTYHFRMVASNDYGTSLGEDRTFATLESQLLDADFIADTIYGIAPLVVHFTDQSTGLIDGREWDFGDGSADRSLDQTDPAHVFRSDGEFTVSLTVTGPGGSDAETKPGYITVDSCDIRPIKYQTQSLAGGYDNLEDAIRFAGNNEVIEFHGREFVGDIEIDSGKTLVLEGGFECYYDEKVADTLIRGRLIIEDGVAVVNGIVLGP